MAASKGFDLGNLRFQTFDPRTRQREAEIHALVRRSVEADFPHRTPGEREYFLGQIASKSHDPNAGVGGPLIRRKQEYARPLRIVALLEGDVVATVTSADNVSNYFPGPLGKRERNAKLTKEDLIAKRWAWLGQCAVEPELRPPVDEDTGDVNIVDILLARAAIHYDPRQSFSAYPYSREHWWRIGLEGAGLHIAMVSPGIGSDRDAEPETRNVQAFGEKPISPVEQGHLVGGIEHVVETISQKEGLPDETRYIVDYRQELWTRG